MYIYLCVCAYVGLWTMSLLIQIMACHLMSTKQSLAPKLNYCSLDPRSKLLENVICKISTIPFSSCIDTSKTMKAMPLPTHMKSIQQAVNKHWPNQYIVLVTNNNPSTYIKTIRLIHDMCSLIYDEILLVLKAEYSRIPWLMPWLLMPWLYVLPGHLQLLYWICKINGSLASVRKGFN